MAISVTYELPDGGSRELLVPAGTSLMQAAISGGAPGIVAECGGQLMCATCHVYVEDSDGALPDMSHVFPKRLGTPAEFARLVRCFMEVTLLNGEVVRLDAATRLG